ERRRIGLSVACPPDLLLELVLLLVPELVLELLPDLAPDLFPDLVPDRIADLVRELPPDLARPPAPDLLPDSVPHPPEAIRDQAPSVEHVGDSRPFERGVAPDVIRRGQQVCRPIGLIDPVFGVRSVRGGGTQANGQPLVAHD